MKNLPLATISGVVVMAAGIAALVGMASEPGPGTEAAPDSAPAASVATSGGATINEVSGIDESVHRTLENYGVINGLDPTELSELEPVIVRVLEEFEVTLTVPIDDGPNP